MFKQSKEHLFGELTPTTHRDTSTVHSRKLKERDLIELKPHVLLIDDEVAAR